MSANLTEVFLRAYPLGHLGRPIPRLEETDPGRTLTDVLEPPRVL
jgi:hypothetical protein